MDSKRMHDEIERLCVENENWRKNYKSLRARVERLEGLLQEAKNLLSDHYPDEATIHKRIDAELGGEHGTK